MRWAVSLLLVCAFAASAQTKQAKFTWEVPGVIETVTVPGTPRALGVPVRLQAARSKLPGDELLAFFAKRFAAAGLYIPPPSRQVQVTREAALTALDPATLVSYTVILQPNRDGTTTVIMGEANLALRAQAQAQGAEIAPVFPGATGLLRSEQEGLRTLAYSAAGTPEEVLAFYRELLVKDGYRESEPGAFLKGEDQLRVSARAEGKGRVTVAVISSRAAFAVPDEKP